MGDARNPIALLKARVRKACGGDGNEPWNPNGGGQFAGTVKLWMNTKGFGFITETSTGEEIFCHHGDIGGRSPVKGGNVTFDKTQMDNGKTNAINVSGDVGPRIDTRDDGKGKGDKWGGKGDKSGKGAGFAPYNGKGGKKGGA